MYSILYTLQVKKEKINYLEGIYLCNTILKICCTLLYFHFVYRFNCNRSLISGGNILFEEKEDVMIFYNYDEKTVLCFEFLPSLCLHESLLEHGECVNKHQQVHLLYFNGPCTTLLQGTG